MSALNWFVAKTIPVHRIEFDVRHALAQREHPALVPFETKTVQNPRTKMPDEKKFPFFPCYVVAAFRDHRDFLVTKAAVNKQFEDRGKRPPIVSLIGFGGRPAILSPDDVELVRSFSVEKPTTINLHKAFKAGDQIRILDGAWVGHTMEFKAAKKDKLIALGTMFERMLMIELPVTTAVEAA